MRNKSTRTGVASLIATFMMVGLTGCRPGLRPPDVVEDLSNVEDLDNMVHEVEVSRDGRSTDYKETRLDDKAFSREEIDPKPKKDDPKEPHVPSRIHPLLEKMISEGDPSTVVSVLIVLHGGAEVGRLPDLPDGVSRTSSRGQELSRELETRISELRKKNMEVSQRFLGEAAERRVRLTIEEQYWIINGFRSDVRLGDVKALLGIPLLRYIQPQLTGEPPPQDSNADNDVDDGRRLIVSDPYFALGLTSGYIGLLDTGIRSTHQLFNIPSNVDLLQDCVNGGPTCDDATAVGWDPTDNFWDHGTSSAAILVANNRLGNAYRGVTAIRLDSWKVYSNQGLDSGATIRAIQRALAAFDRVLIAEIQATEGENGPIALACDNAYDAGAVIVAANGNFGSDARAYTVASPALAHKVIGTGAYDIASRNQYDNQSRGPAPDGRPKPDVQTPNNSETASGTSDTALKIFGGTSGATPYASGAAALMRNWLREHNTFDSGQVYSRMILSGPLLWGSFDNTAGVGRIGMPTCFHAWWGKVKVNNGTVVTIDINVGTSRRDMAAALWWPEAQSEAHDDIDLTLIDPGGSTRANSDSGVSIFERAGVAGALTPGTWRLRIRGYNVQSGPQTVYWTTDIHGC